MSDKPRLIMRQIPARNVGYDIVIQADCVYKDVHLSVVVGCWDDRKLDWVCWLYNHETGGFSDGIYGHRLQVMSVFDTRVERYM